MQNTFTERRYGGEFLVSEGEGDISREVVTIKMGQVLKAGAPLGQITTGGKYTFVAPALSDGSQTAAALLFDDVDATAADTKAVVIKRLAEYNESLIPWGSLTTNQIAAVKTQLSVLNLIARKGI